MPENQDILISTSQMTALFEITRQGLSRWVERGMPKKDRNQYFLYDCLEWVKRNVWFVGVGKEDLAHEKLKYQKARSRREELRVQEEEGALVSRDAAVQWLVTGISEARLAFQGLPRRVSSVLATMQDEKDIEQCLHDEVWRILRRLSDAKKRPLPSRK